MRFIDILDGHIKELFGANENLSNKRLKICMKCPLYKKTPVGPICNSSLYISKDGKDVVNYGKEGYVKGCGCNLSKKVRLSNAKCIIRKW